MMLNYRTPETVIANAMAAIEAGLSGKPHPMHRKSVPEQILHRINYEAAFYPKQPQHPKWAVAQSPNPHGYGEGRYMGD